MAKTKRKEKQAETPPEIAFANEQYGKLSAELLAAEDAGVLEYNFFDGSVFRYNTVAKSWYIETGYDFYHERYKNPANEKSAWDKVSEARSIIREISPYFIKAVLGVSYYQAWGFQAWCNARTLEAWWRGDDHAHPQVFPVGDPRGAFMAFASANGVVGYDPNVLVNMSTEEVAPLLIHEAMHIQRDHGNNPLTGDQRTDNIVYDIEINDDIKAMGYKIDESDWWLPSTVKAPEFLHAADYLRYLPKPPPKQDKSNTGEGDGGDGGEEDGEGSEGKGQRKPKLSLGPKDPKCGSGSGGERLEPEENLPENLTRDDASLEATRQAVAKDVVNYANGEKGGGNIPAGLLRWAEGALKPAEANWRKLVRPTVRRLTTKKRGYAYMDSTLSKKTLNALALADDITKVPLQYSMHTPRPRILIALDTSGSMDGDALNSALGEIRGGLKLNAADVYFIAFDCAVYKEPELVTSLNSIKRLVYGGGGTDVMAVYNHEKVRRQRFDAIITITDGDTPISPTCPLKTENVFIIIKGRSPFSNGKQWQKTKVIHVS